MVKLQKVAKTCVLDVSAIVAVYLKRESLYVETLEICLQHSSPVVLYVTDLTDLGKSLFKELLDERNKDH